MEQAEQAEHLAEQAEHLEEQLADAEVQGRGQLFLAESQDSSLDQRAPPVLEFESRGSYNY